MPLRISIMNDDDFARAFEILSSAFGQNHPFFNQYWPAHDTPEGRTIGAQRLKGMTIDPNTVFLKAVDTDLNAAPDPHSQMVGMAKWTFYKDNAETPSMKIVNGPYWDDGKGDKKYAELISEAFFQRRLKAIAQSGGNLAILDYLAVDPHYHGKGAGSMLVKWGVDEADKYNLGSTIEASAKGARVYQKFGYVRLEHVSLAMPEPYAHLPREETAWMERPRRDGYMWDGRKTMTSNWLGEP